ncbi:hypothetical protein CYMTET_36932 [Cymbomonas tetramitiformis]|uniref:EF-hand domain-containing protein n=1 Tax=Cymbomonas tetramitiformis TaxID=36881 RepID=A0AAE0CH75_9CHLO|nr:hypothetical protein CYMTET_36932 [Cymbomonas tetramitiformis]
MRFTLFALVACATLPPRSVARQLLSFSDSNEPIEKANAPMEDVEGRDVGVAYEERGDGSDERFSEYAQGLDGYEDEETSESLNAWASHETEGYRMIGQGVCSVSSSHHVVVYEGRPSVPVGKCHSECAATLVCKGFAHREGDNRCFMYHSKPSQIVDTPCGRNGECYVCYRLTEDEADSESAPSERWGAETSEPEWQNLQVTVAMQQYYDLDDPLWQFAQKWTRAEAFSEKTQDVILEIDEGGDSRAMEWLKIADRDRSRTVDREELTTLAVATLDAVMRAALDRV